MPASVDSIVTTAPRPAVRDDQLKSGTLPARRFRTDVQGLRAIAVGLVLLYHAGLPFLPGGYTGVDVFFVISGFLISSHLLEAIERDGRIDFGRFYARRALRILPASFAVAVLTAGAVIAFAPPLTVPGGLQDALATVLYAPNIWFANQEADYLADHAPSPFQHYWSLGVEEQFYLLWPVLLLHIALFVRRRRVAVALAIAAVAGMSFAACVLLTQAQQPLAFFLLPTRAWELLVGAIVAVALLGGVPRLSARLRAAGGWVGVAAILAGAVLFDETTVFPGAAAALPVAGTALVLLCGSGDPRGGPSAMLSIRPMQFIGLISYSLYLVHWPLLTIPRSIVGFDRPLPLWSTMLLGVFLAVPLAYLLFRFVEQPLRAPRSLTLRRPAFTLLGTGVVTAVIAASLVVGGKWAGEQPLKGGQAVAPAPAFPTDPPTATKFVPANLTPSLDDVDGDIPPVYPDGCHHDTETVAVQDCVYGSRDSSRSVVLFGDSHSAQWLPALEELAQVREGFAIHSYTKSSCPAVEVTVLVKNLTYDACDTWRAAVLDAIRVDPPDLVVTSSYSGYALAGHPKGADRVGRWSDGLQRTVKGLTDAGIDVLVIADTPRFESAPAVCVSSHLTDVDACAGARSTVLDPVLAAAERDASVASGGRFADLTGYICGKTTCPAIIDDLLVYRDVNHLTATFVRYLAPALGDRLQVG